MPLPPADHKKPDITVHFDGIIPKNADRSPTPTGRMWKKEGDYYKLCYYNQTGYVIQFKINSSGTSIHISQSWPEWGDTLFVLMNPAMAAAISLQGYPILHGSSMVCNGNAFVISGISGAGKSSLTTALAAEGVALHSDDISVVDMDATMPRVAPGYPRLKIDTTLPQYLSLNDATLLPVVTTEADLSEKWISADELPGGFHPDSAPLSGIFVLLERLPDQDTPSVTRLSPMAGTLALTEHIYGREWLNPPDFQHLQFCRQLAESLPIYQVSMPDNLSKLSESARFLLNNYILTLTEHKPV